MAHVGPPDMRHAIGYALHWPDRRDLPVARLDLAQIGTLSFSRRPIRRAIPRCDLAREVMATGGLAGAVFNAAKEAALDAFHRRQRSGSCAMAPLVVDACLTPCRPRTGWKMPR